MGLTVYRRRHPEKTALYQVVQEHYRTFLEVCEEGERPLPAFVRREFEGFLGCGILAQGFVRVRCADCGYDRLVSLSCKRRGFCGACLGRQMSEAAAHLVENVLPAVPMRHWVLSLPPPLRYLLAYDRSLCTEVLKIYQRKLFGWLRKRAKRELSLASVKEAHPGAITVVQRASSHLALNVHFHTLAADGVFVEVGDEVEFRELPPPSEEEIGECWPWGHGRVSVWCASTGRPRGDRCRSSGLPTASTCTPGRGSRGRIGRGWSGCAGTCSGRRWPRSA